MPHIHEKIDFVADVYVVCGDAVLLRRHDKYGTWLTPGGHIELDEGPTEAAIRECLEEVGLRIELHDPRPPEQRVLSGDLLPPQFINRHPISNTHEHISFVYFGLAKTRQLALSETEKSSACKWFTREELLDTHYGISSVVQYYALRALETLSE